MNHAQSAHRIDPMDGPPSPAEPAADVYQSLPPDGTERLRQRLEADLHQFLRAGGSIRVAGHGETGLPF